MAVPISEQRKLFQRSGDMCAFPGCRTALTAAASGADRLVALGEMAHIVADSPNGPRGASVLTKAERDRYENLVLLCGLHHELIDSQPSTWTVEVLHAVKAAHETWVRQRLGGLDAAAGIPAPAGPLWMVPEAGRMLVERTEELTGLADLVLGGAAVVGVLGAGGFGKTTLVAQACHRLRDAFAGGVLWATLGEQMPDPALAEKINDLSELVDGTRPALTDPAAAGYHLGVLLARRAPTLLVVDDVWAASRLVPFLHSGARVIVTTRSRGALPGTAKVLHLPPLGLELSRSLLRLGVPGLTRTTRLVRRTGGWPILLALVNSAILRLVDDGLAPNDAGDAVAELLADGPDSLDLASADRRDQAVRATVEASLRRLDPQSRQRCLELGVFPEDTDVPAEVAQLLWATSPSTARRLVRTLADLALISVSGDRLRLHDVLREHLRRILGPDGLAEANGRLVEALRADAAGDWAGAREYSRAHLAGHAADAGALDALLLDAAFLLAARPPGLLESLPEARTAAGRAAALSYQRIVHHLRDRPAAESPAYLELAARQAGAATLADGAGRLAGSAPWRCAWARWYVEPPHTILTRHRYAVDQVAVVPRADGRTLVVSVGPYYCVRVVDGTRNTPVELPWPLPAGEPSALACVELPDAGHVFVVGTVLGNVAAWHVDTGTAVPWDLPWQPPEQIADPWVDPEEHLPVGPVLPIDGCEHVIPDADPWDEAAPPPPASVWLAGPPEPGELDWRAEPVDAPEIGEPTEPDESGRPAPRRLTALEPPPDEPDDPGEYPDEYLEHLLGRDFDTLMDEWCIDEFPPEEIRWIRSAPAPGGPVLVIARQDGAVWAVDTTTDRHDFALVTWTRRGDEQPLVTLSRDGWRYTWELKTGRVVEDGHGIAAQSAVTAWLPDGSEVSGLADGSVAIVNRPAGRVTALVDLHPDPVCSLAAGRTADGRVLLATGGGDADGTVRLWEVGALLRHDAQAKPLAIERVVAAGGLVATAHPDPVVRIWADGRIVRELQHERPVTELFTVSDPAGAALLVCGAAGAPPRVWDLANGGRVDHGLSAVTGTVLAGAATPEAVLLITAEGDAVRAWDAVDGRPRWHIPVAGVHAMTTSDGRLLIVHSGQRGDKPNRHVSVHDAATGRPAGPSMDFYYYWPRPVVSGSTLSDAPVAVYLAYGDVHACDQDTGTHLASIQLADIGSDSVVRRDSWGMFHTSDIALLRTADGGVIAAVGGPVVRLLRLEPGEDRSATPFTWRWVSDVYFDTPVTTLAADGDTLLVGTARGLAALRIQPPAP
ncbi:NB-ARC domain-containing protein [Dactylosporangium sp. CS-033363]|uniref:NB-ARC domain-containing protein n=1 Tax=Dactylosporangium sp. CS-033363 TaxID=3239935 RepID=UPI003D89BBAB